MKDKTKNQDTPTVVYVPDGIRKQLSATEDKAKEKAAALLMIGGPFNGALYELLGEKLSVGRNNSNTIQIQLDGISRTHFELLKVEAHWYIQDLGSKNGTYLNDKKLEHKHRLKKGDVIKVLDIAFKFIPEGDHERLAYDQLSKEAITDGHTGCYTKDHFKKCLKEQFNEAKTSEQSLSLIILDIDLFKQFNDTHGHHAGDYLLTHVAELVRSKVLGDHDIFARFGGEEFVILMPHTNLESACITAERIRGLIENTTFEYESAKLNVTVSLGVSEVTAAMKKAADLFKNADKATYHAKRLGRNRVATYS